MDSKRLKQAFKKAFTITTAVFSASVVLLAVLSALFGELVYPESILRLFAVFFMLYFLSVVRIYFAGSRWASNKPYILINIMFAPLYFACGVLGLFANNSYIEPSYILVLTPIFIVTFSIAQLVTYLVKKAGTDKMNDALNEFHKEHQEDGYEEEMADGNQGI